MRRSTQVELGTSFGRQKGFPDLLSGTIQFLGDAGIQRARGIAQLRGAIARVNCIALYVLSTRPCRASARGASSRDNVA